MAKEIQTNNNISSNYYGQWTYTVTQSPGSRTVSLSGFIYSIPRPFFSLFLLYKAPTFHSQWCLQDSKKQLFTLSSSDETLYPALVSRFYFALVISYSLLELALYSLRFRLFDIRLFRGTYWIVETVVLVVSNIRFVSHILLVSYFFCLYHYYAYIHNPK